MEGSEVGNGSTENDCVELQKDLDILQEWSNKWLLSFHEKNMQGYEIRRAAPRVYL